MNVSLALKQFVTLGPLLLALTVSSVPVFAQTNLPIAPVTPAASGEPTSILQIQLHNVQPSIVGAWFDAARSGHRSSPLVTAIPSSDIFRSISSLPRLPGNGLGPSDLEWPQGVTSIACLDSRNLLLAYGTAEGLKSFQKLIPKVDVPLVQYEVEARFCKINRSNLKEIGLTFPDQGNSAYEFGSVVNAPNDVLARVSKLGDKKIKVLSSPRLLVIDGLEASVQQTVSTPFIVNEKLTLAKQPPPESSVFSGVATLNSGIGVRTVVVRRPENIVSFALAPSFGARSLSLETNIHEDTILAIQMSPKEEKEQLIAIVTVKRIQRAGEENSVG